MNEMAEKATGSSENTAITKRWGKPTTEAGWTAVPNAIIRHQVELGLDSLDLNILLNLWQHWWERKKLPHPAVTTIAATIGVDRSTVQRRLREMERKGLLKRKYRKTSKLNNLTSEYAFDGLRKKAVPFANKMLEEKKKKKEGVTK